MEKFSSGRHGKNGFSLIGLIIVLLIVAGVIGYFSYQLFFVSKPAIKGMDALNVLNADKTVTLQGENLKTIDISIQQGGKKINLLKDTPLSREKTYTLQIKPKALGLSDGPATFIIEAEAGILKKLKQQVNTIIDTSPPYLEVLSATSVIENGGAGLTLLRAEGADSVFVKLDERIFRGFPAISNADSTGKETTINYYVLFPVPLDMKSGSTFYAVAKDAAGNQSIRNLPVSMKIIRYRSSSINIDDSFIDKVAAPLLNETNISDREAAFKKVNEELRTASIKKLFDTAQKTEPRMLWDGAFLQMKNSKVMATYGDARAYIYKGKSISRSIHLGYDLASNAHSPVEAANTGIINFAGDLGIYGNTVVIDHGTGLMSLYGHMSTITVTEGQSVKKGDIIGKTGATGLAGGDHLHFGILIEGYEVSPLYWWDQHWIKVNILDHLRP
ncbi:MAG: M23 family metallopeptidase [Nitrospirae bacterium]|nr:M23 family metallopeptidase [Nitrospirota bacterium]